TTPVIPFFFQAEDGIRDRNVTGVQTCALPISTRLVEIGNWIDNVSNFIVSPIGALILTCIIFLGFLYQLYSNRINIIGIISTLALFIFFLGFFIKGDVNFYSVVLFAIGVIFVII